MKILYNDLLIYFISRELHLDRQQKYSCNHFNLPPTYQKKKDFLTCYIKNHPGLRSGDRYLMGEDGTRLPWSPSMTTSGMGILFPFEPGKVPLAMTLEVCLKTGHGPV